MARNLKGPDDLEWGPENIKGRMDNTGIILGTGMTVTGGSTNAQVVTSVSTTNKIRAGTAALTTNSFAVATGLTTLVAVTVTPIGAGYTTNSNAYSATLSAGSTAGAFTVLSYMASTNGSLVGYIGATTVSVTVSYVAVGA
jgi:hypothetical protein